MIIRPWVQFTTDIPDDSIEKAGEWVQWSGRAVSIAIAEMLTRRGYEVDGPHDMQETGWDLEVNVGSRHLFIRINEVYNFSLLFEQAEVLFTRRRVWPEYIRALTDLNDELNSDDRFRVIGWSTQSEFDSGVVGAQTPVDESSPPASKFGFLRKWGARIGDLL